MPDWNYTNGEVDRETHPEPGVGGISMYLCDSCGCSLEKGERVLLDPFEGLLTCCTCESQSSK